MKNADRRMRGLKAQRMLQGCPVSCRRERSLKNRKAANISLYKRPEQLMGVSSASKELSAEDSSFRNGVNSSDEEDGNLVPVESERGETNADGERELRGYAENENLAANEGVNCRNTDIFENFLSLPEEEANNEDYTMYEQLCPLMSETEYKKTYGSMFTLDDFLILEDGQSMMEQNEGRRTTKNDESTERNNERCEEKATASTNGTKKAKKKGGKKTKKFTSSTNGTKKAKKKGGNKTKKFSIAERKAQKLLMEVLQQLCGGEYNVHVSRNYLREKAKSLDRTNRVTDTGVLDTALRTTVGMTMNERGDKFMRGYKEYTKEMQYWIEGPNGEGSTTWIVEDYGNIKEQNIKLQEDNLMIEQENEMLKGMLEMVQENVKNGEEKLDKMEKRNQDLENQLRECRGMLADLHQYTCKLEELHRIK